MYTNYNLRCEIMIVEEVMNKKLEFIEPDATVLDVIERLVDKRIRSLIVKPVREGDVHGVVTIRDIVFRCLSEGKDPQNVRVKDITSKPMIYVKKGMRIEDVVNFMKKLDIARVFVEEKGEIIGIVALMDIVATYLAGEMRTDSLRFHS